MRPANAGGERYLTRLLLDAFSGELASLWIKSDRSAEVQRLTDDHALAETTGDQAIVRSCFIYLYGPPTGPAAAVEMMRRTGCDEFDIGWGANEDKTRHESESDTRTKIRKAKVVLLRSAFDAHVCLFRHER